MAASEDLSGVLVTETHLDNMEGEIERTYWTKRGWNAQFAPGQYDDGFLEEQVEGLDRRSTRTRGGVMMMLRNHVRSDHLDLALAELGTEDLAAMVLHSKGRRLLGPLPFRCILHLRIGTKGPLTAFQRGFAPAC